jgi:hypothetical protein
MPRGIHGNHATATRQHRWNEGRMIASTGYAKVRVGRTHPLADRNGYVYEHKLVWFSAGRTTLPGCVIHHSNGVKTDNRIENLEMLPRGTHNAHHNAERGRKSDGTFKKAAGDLLDGVQHHAFPEVR